MLFLAPGRTGKLSDTGTGAERMEGGGVGGRHAKEMDKLLASFGVLGGVGQSVPT